MRGCPRCGEYYAISKKRPNILERLVTLFLGASRMLCHSCGRRFIRIENNVPQ